MPVTINGSGPITGLTSIASPTTLNGLTIPTTGFGKVLQVVRATDSTLRSTTSTSYVDVTGMSVTITPQVNTSSILLIATTNFEPSSNSSTDLYGWATITTSSNVNISGTEMVIGTQGLSTGGGLGIPYIPMVLIGYHSPATTSATTYKMRFKSNSASVTVTATNSRPTGQMYALEISA